MAEAGRSISAANKARIKTVLDMLGELYGEEEAPAEVKEAVLKIGPVASIQDVKAAMRRLIAYIPNATTREALEGDGDGDEDFEALVSGIEGDPLSSSNESAKKIFFDLLTEAALDTATRNALPSSAFVFPKTRDYPIHDATHARNALARASGKPEEAAVRAAVKKKYPKIGTADSDDKKQSEAGISCAACGEPVGRYDDFCGGCGEGLSRNYGTPQAHCVGCGTTLNEDNNFCPSCGADASPSKATKAKQESRAAHPDWKFTESMKVHDPEDFVKLSVSDQKNHLILEHGVAEDSLNLTKPERRKKQHTHDHAFDEAEDVDIETEFIQLKERAIGKDGSMLIKMIAPGWGASGFYSPQLLERDGPLRFPRGTKMYLDHPTPQEEKDRPERSVRDLAAVTESDAKFMPQGPDGAGLYSKAKPIATFAPLIEELAPHIGVSIRASGRSKMGEVNGKKGPIIEAITAGHSCDFVTEPGAGGTVSQLLESARARINNKKTTEVNDDVSEQELQEARTKLKETEDERDKYHARLLVRDAKDMAFDVLARVDNIPVPSQRRIAESVSHDPPTDAYGELDKKKFLTKIREAVEDEARYIEQLRPTGRVRGMGRSNDNWEDADDDPLDFFGGESRRSSRNNDDDGGDEEKSESGFEKALQREFAGIGLKESTAAAAASGRLR
jgi:hypothetical protein